jgi:hypothetical protein
MKLEEHEKAYEEHKKNIDKFIEEGIEKNQRNVGFNVSQGSVELLAIFLHKLNLLQSSGDQLDHRIFKSKQLVKKKLPFGFAERSKIIDLMEKIEIERNVLCYGTRKPVERITKMIKNFQKLRSLINKNLKNGK